MKLMVPQVKAMLYPTLLALETSSSACSIALQYGQVIVKRHEILPQQHASVILDWIAELLNEQNMTLKDLDAIAYSCGPGSFTGIRISAAVSQGLSMAYSKPLIAVPSLQVIAQGVFRRSGVQKIIVLLDARMNQVYCGYYRVGEQGWVESYRPDQIVFLRELDLNALSNENGVLVTDLPEKERAIFQLTFFPDVVIDCYPYGEDLLFLANVQMEEGKTVSPEEALPIYLRLKDAWKKS